MPTTVEVTESNDATFMDPASVMGMRKNTKISKTGDTVLDNSAVMQFTDLANQFG